MISPADPRKTGHATVILWTPMKSRSSTASPCNLEAKLGSLPHSDHQLIEGFCLRVAAAQSGNGGYEVTFGVPLNDYAEFSRHRYLSSNSTLRDQSASGSSACVRPARCSLRASSASRWSVGCDLAKAASQRSSLRGDYGNERIEENAADRGVWLELFELTQLVLRTRPKWASMCSDYRLLSIGNRAAFMA